jgi:hypothetical protein
MALRWRDFSTQERVVSQDFYEARIKELADQNNALRLKVEANTEEIRKSIGLLHGVSIGDRVRYNGDEYVVGYIDATFGATRKSKPWLRGRKIKKDGGALRHLYSGWEKVSDK